MRTISRDALEMHALVAAMPKQWTTWHEGRSALRMLVAALAAYASSTVIHLPGPYSAVITTLIVARPHSSGVLRASFERLTATLLGAGLACLATFGRLIHVPELLLITVALSPLALITAHNSAYRTAMIAAMIVFSAPATGGAPLYAAGVRMLGVSLGAVIGAFVSVAILPSRRETVVARAARKLLRDYLTLLRNAIEAATEPTEERDRGEQHEKKQGVLGQRATQKRTSRRLTRYKLEAEVRQALRELALLIRDRPDALPTGGTAGAIVKYTLQMHADISFLKRELLRLGEPIPPVVNSSLLTFAHSLEDIVTRVTLMKRGEAPAINIQPLRHSCGEAIRCLHEHCTDSEGAPLMLRRLTEDFAGVVRSIERAMCP